MISDAVIIGAVNAAIYRDNDYLKAIRLENNRVVDCTRDIAMLLDSNAEKRYISPAPNSIEQLTKTLQFWSQRHHVLTLVLTAMDSICSDSTRSACIKAAEQALTNPKIFEFVQARLLGCPIPQIADLTGAIRLAASYPVIAALYTQLNLTQNLIKPVSRLLQSLLRYEFKGDYDADHIMRLFVDHGLVSIAVIAVHENDKGKLENLIFQFGDTPELTDLPHLTHFLTLFKNRLIEQFTTQNKPIKTEEKQKTEPLNKHLGKNLPMTAVTIRMAVGVLNDLKLIAPKLGFSSYQPLIRNYVGQRLREDLDRLGTDAATELVKNLKNRGVSDHIIADALSEFVQKSTEINRNP